MKEQNQAAHSGVAPLSVCNNQSSSTEVNQQMLEMLRKCQDDINWMCNSGELLNRSVFQYLDDTIAAAEEANGEWLKTLKKCQEDINWMCNSGKLLNRFVFQYLDDTIAAAEDANAA